MNHNHEPQLILFDCDGTLTNSHAAILQAMQRAFADCGYDTPSDMQVMGIIGLSLHAAVDYLFEVTGQGATDIRVSHAFCDHYVGSEHEIMLYPGVIETLQQLQQRGYWMGVVTGKSKAGLERVLQRFELKQFFPVWRTADCCMSKPHPEMALQCMMEMGVDSRQTCIVGDASFDMQMAKAANTRAIGVSFGVSSSEMLMQQGAELVIDSFPQLLDCFVRLT